MTVCADNLQIITEGYARFMGGDMEAFFTMFDDSVEMVEADALPYGGVYRGKSAVREAILTVARLWDGINLDIHVLTAGEDYVIAYGQFSATAHSTGRAVSFPLSEVWRLREGKVVFLNPVYGDTVLACAALQGGAR